jgi:hypothetical protein
VTFSLGCPAWIPTGADILLDEQTTGDSSSRTVHRVVARKA